MIRVTFSDNVPRLRRSIRSFHLTQRQPTPAREPRVPGTPERAGLTSRRAYGAGLCRDVIRPAGCRQSHFDAPSLRRPSVKWRHPDLPDKIHSRSLSPWQRSERRRRDQKLAQGKALGQE